MKARWIITAISAAIFVIGNLSTSLQDPWFQNLQRPDWLTFEFLIPFFWTFIWICTTISAILVWERAPKSRVGLMAMYGAIALLTTLYSPVVAEFRSLAGGLILGGAATLLVYITAALVLRTSRTASALLIPYAIWGPIGTYLTWVLIRLNS